MSIGSMKHRVTVQVWSQVTDPGGGVSEDWTDEVTTWASVKPLSSKRMVVDSQVVISDGYTLILRWADGRILDKKRRIIYGTKTLTIGGAQVVDEAKRFYKLTCLENS
jgi:SPP1 family predicted phage head-tail adaptor